MGIRRSPPSPLQVHITGRLQRQSAAFGNAQKQCPHCEAPGLKTGKSYPDDGAALSLVQRGSLPNADTDPSIVGKQFGGSQAKPADLDAITAAHVKKVINGVSGELGGMATKFAGDPASAICDAAGVRDSFLSTLEATVRVLAR